MEMDFLSDLGRRVTQSTDDHSESAFLFQRLSVLIQRQNAVAVQWRHFSKTLRGLSADPTGDRSYPPRNHLPPPEDTGTELSAVDSRPTFISNIHLTSF